ncbi:pilus assembly chaperone domain protein [Burkholderia pseudomallei MSHR7500]|nr:pilus assembly chaperone domain protein [Burkholderia pseudomallei MSHR7500]
MRAVMENVRRRGGGVLSGFDLVPGGDRHHRNPRRLSGKQSRGQRSAQQRRAVAGIGAGVDR